MNLTAFWKWAGMSKEDHYSGPIKLILPCSRERTEPKHECLPHNPSLLQHNLRICVWDGLEHSARYNG